MKSLNDHFHFFCCLFLLLHTCLRCTSAPLFFTCSSHNYTTGSGYKDSLMDLATTLRNHSSLSLYRNATSTPSPTRQSAYGMFQCRGDVSQDKCRACVNETLDIALNHNCSKGMGADFQQDDCHVRYDNNSALFDGTNPDMGKWYLMWNANQKNDSTFQNDVTMALQNVTGSAPSDPNYYASKRQGLVYALAQCDGYLSEKQCRFCLSNVAAMLDLNSAEGGRIYYHSCFYRYEAYLFYEILSPPPSPVSNPAPQSLSSPPPLSVSNSSMHSSSLPIGAVVGGSVGVIVLLGLILGFLFYCCRNKTTQSITGILSDDGRYVFADPVTNFSYKELKAATQDFHLDNKIGAGGFGPVYKGTLANGLEVAIKKLSANSNQGKREFMNEVSVITSVQHRNLIKLLGCCAEGSERLLVYEYLPNKSLDKFIFDNEDRGSSSNNKKSAKMDWNTRMNVIIGTARGLSYLHEDSQVRIIHRDIKASNILLDEGLAPKIADFGLAKLFSHDATHVTTRVAGTLGYLSPEYALRGQLTEKADVYSFGVLALEIVSGRRNDDFQQPPEKQRLLDWAWQCYLEGSQILLLDPKLSTMNPSSPIEEVIRVIHVALLCLQSSPLDRPSMTKVVQLLVGQSHILAIPKMPQYIFNLLDEANVTRFETGSIVESHGRSATTPLRHDNLSLNLEQISFNDVSAR